MRKIAVLVALCSCACVGLAQPGGLASPAEQDRLPDSVAELAILLRPLPSADGSGIEALEVVETLAGATAEPGGVLLEMPYVSSNVPTAIAQIGELQARDERGALALAAHDEGADPERRRQWRIDRPVHGSIRLSYRVTLAAPLAARGAAPPIELRSEDGGFSGGGATFLLRPPGGSYRLRADWDLSRLPAGAVAASSLDTVADAPLPVATLDKAYFMAGSVGRYPAAPSATGFFSVWQGRPPFDATGLMSWAERLRTHYEAFFAVERTPYGVFMRRNLVNPGGGIGMYRSFVITYGEQEGSDPEELKLTLAHEMFHTFQPRIEDAGNGLESAWFNEGLAVFYQRSLPLRYGMLDADGFLRDLNYHAARYYTNALGNVPNREVPARFWEDTRVRTLPYDRGFLYFATVDDAVRKASHGRRSLDDLMLQMHARQRRGVAIDNADWEELLRRELGQPGVDAFHAMLQGATPLPASDAFGPCFRRISVPLRRYQLGFEPKVLTEPRRIVHGLIPGSAAEAAGLRDGDEIMVPVGQDAIQGRQDGVLVLQVRRDGQDLRIAYRPRGETVDAWQWQRVDPVPGQRCSLAPDAATTDRRAPAIFPVARIGLAGPRVDRR
ncbi:peptidase M61 [Stenotrophomonas sp. MMGLT7]|uniref:peptidase M61 n=1 Tax=Stenotrophomonas sp. MMGLT7 TaxID=2901227 RepID=UPI001E3FCF0D|nr:peptidase M61 [Stenotrophomonas sp. MMGLT7]MCD7099238.1 peptidase M61 [Stenotrophomonas sp. MMGLT7]